MNVTAQGRPGKKGQTMKMLDTTEKLFTPKDAERMAKTLQAGDSDWTYTVVHCPKGTGYSFIEIHDEDGDFVSKV